MEEILTKSNLLIQNQSLDFVRSLQGRIDWNDRAIGLLGARGTGKTTLLLRRLKQHYGLSGKAVYVSLDDIFFSENKLVHFGNWFVAQGGNVLFADEVHKYPNWAREIKNLYDTHPELRIVFTGSSITDFLQHDADLSRRAVRYELPGLSFREYLSFQKVFHQQPLALNELLTRHAEIAVEWVSQFRPLKYFTDYLARGYYPFFAENPNTYHIRLEQVVKMIIETDLRYLEGFDPANSRKVFQLLYILATNVPFKPNVTKLSTKIGIHRNTLVSYLQHLEKARLINTLTATGKSISTLQKPDKIYLENTNLQFALAPTLVNRGTQRETFFMNQLIHARHRITLPVKGDFLVDDQFTFEIGGRDKSIQQKKAADQGFVVADDLEVGVLQKIPLWLFGFLY